MTSSFIHPSLIMILGACILPFFKEPFRKPYLVLVPVLAFLDVLYLSGHAGTYGVFQFMQ